MAVQRSDNVLRHLYFKFVNREYVCFCLRMLDVQRIRVIPCFNVCAPSPCGLYINVTGNFKTYSLEKVSISSLSTLFLQ